MNLGLKNYTQTGEPEIIGGYYCIPLTVDQPRRDVHCPVCGGDKLTKHGARRQEIMDIPFQGTPVKLFIKKLRYKCNICSTAFPEPLPEADEKFKMTSRLSDYIKRHIKNKDKPYPELSEKLGISIQAIRKVAQSMGQNNIDADMYFKTPRVIGIHELKLYGTSVVFFTNIEEETIINIIPKRHIDELLEEYLINMPNKEYVRYIIPDVLDMLLIEIQRNIKELRFPRAQLVISKDIIENRLTRKFLNIILPKILYKYKELPYNRLIYQLKHIILSAMKQKDSTGQLSEYFYHIPDFKETYQEYISLINLINNPSNNLINKLHEARIHETEKEPGQLYIKSLRNTVFKFEAELSHNIDYQPSIYYTRIIDLLRQNLRKLDDTYSLSQLWAQLKDKNNIEETKFIENKVASEYHSLIREEHQSFGISISALIKAFSRISID